MCLACAAHRYSLVFQEPRFAGKPEYSSHLVVHKDAVFSDMDSLRGARIAFNDAMSLSGYHICLIWLIEHGRSPDMFSEWLPSVSCLVGCSACSNR